MFVSFASRSIIQKKCYGNSDIIFTGALERLWRMERKTMARWLCSLVHHCLSVRVTKKVSICSLLFVLNCFLPAFRALSGRCFQTMRNQFLHARRVRPFCVLASKTCCQRKHTPQPETQPAVTNDVLQRLATFINCCNHERQIVTTEGFRF